MKNNKVNYLYLLIWFILVISFVISHLKYNVFPITYILPQIKAEENIYPVSMFGHWIGMDPASWQNKWFYIVFPIFSIVFANIFQREKISKDSIYKQYMEIAIVGSIGGVIPQIISILLVSCFLPSIIPDSTTIFFCITPKCFMAELFYEHPLIYIFIYLFWNGIVGSLMTLIYFQLKKVISRKRMSLIIYCALLVVTCYLFIKMGLRKFCFFNLLNPSQPIEGITIKDCLLYVIGLIIILGVLYACEQKKKMVY